MYRYRNIYIYIDMYIIRYTLYNKVHDIPMKFPNPTPNGLAGAAAPHRVELTTAVAHLPRISHGIPDLGKKRTLCVFITCIYYIYVYIYILYIYI